MKSIKITLVYCLVLVFVLSACSTRSQVRWEKDVNLGDLPSDMSFDSEGNPRIITISSESYGDIIMSYYSTNGRVVAQMYGCAVININCVNLHKQGSYSWSVKTETPGPTPKPFQKPTLKEGERAYYISTGGITDYGELREIISDMATNEATRIDIEDYVINNYIYYLSSSSELYLVITYGPIGTDFQLVQDSYGFSVFTNYEGYLYIQVSRD